MRTADIDMALSLLFCNSVNSAGMHSLCTQANQSHNCTAEKIASPGRVQSAQQRAPGLALPAAGESASQENYTCDCPTMALRLEDRPPQRVVLSFTCGRRWKFCCDAPKPNMAEMGVKQQ